LWSIAQRSLVSYGNEASQKRVQYALV
jgi:hypothetical protein